MRLLMKATLRASRSRLAISSVALPFLGRRHRFGQLRSVSPLAALDLNELLDDYPAGDRRHDTTARRPFPREGRPQFRVHYTLVKVLLKI